MRKKDTGQIYAMKVMRKEKVLEKEHGNYVRAESEILKTVLHPYIVALRYSFQVKDSTSDAISSVKPARTCHNNGQFVQPSSLYCGLAMTYASFSALRRVFC